MNKTKIATIIAGLGIVITTIIMIVHLEKVCYQYCMHPERSLGAWNAVRITATVYGGIICFLTIVLVGLNVRKIK